VNFGNHHYVVVLLAIDVCVFQAKSLEMWMLTCTRIQAAWLVEVLPVQRIPDLQGQFTFNKQFLNLLLNSYSAAVLVQVLEGFRNFKGSWILPCIPELIITMHLAICQVESVHLKHCG